MFLPSLETPQDLHLKRLVRDYLHYDEAVACAAGRIVAALDHEAREHGTTWSSMHVQHRKEAEAEAEAGKSDKEGSLSGTGSSSRSHIIASAKDLLASTPQWLHRPGELLYVATDEADMTWFAPLGQRHATRFLRDYAAEVIARARVWIQYSRKKTMLVQCFEILCQGFTFLCGSDHPFGLVRSFFDCVFVCVFKTLFFISPH